MFQLPHPLLDGPDPRPAPRAACRPGTPAGSTGGSGAGRPRGAMSDSAASPSAALRRRTVSPPRSSRMTSRNVSARRPPDAEPSTSTCQAWRSGWKKRAVCSPRSVEPMPRAMRDALARRRTDAGRARGTRRAARPGASRVSERADGRAVDRSLQAEPGLRRAEAGGAQREVVLVLDDRAAPAIRRVVHLQVEGDTLRSRAGARSACGAAGRAPPPRVREPGARGRASRPFEQGARAAQHEPPPAAAGRAGGRGPGPPVRRPLA